METTTTAATIRGGGVVMSSFSTHTCPSSPALASGCGDGVVSWIGIPFGAGTGGAARFMPPREPPAWTAAMDCTANTAKYVRTKHRSVTHLTVC